MRRPGTVFALLAVLALAVLWPSLAAPLVLDDPEVLQSAPASWGAFLGTLPDPSLRPLARASLVIDRLLAPEAFDRRHWGTMGHSAPAGAYAGPRLVNAALHAANAWLVWCLVSRLLPGRPAASLLAAILFAVHPVSVSAAGYVAQRGTLLATFFGLSACVALMSAPGAAGTVRAALLAAAAVWSHGLGLATLPVLAGLALKGRDAAARRLFFPAAAAGMLLGGWWLRREAGYLAEAGRSASGEVAAQCRALSGETGEAMLARPHALDGAPAGAAWGLVVASFLAAAGMLAAGTERRILAAGAAAAAVLLLPSAVFPLKDPFFAHRLYPAAAAASLCAAVFGAAAERLAGRRALALLGTVVLLAAAAGRTQASSLSGHVRVWTGSCRANPRSARVQVNLGNSWALAGSPSRARAHYARTLAIDPGHRGAAENLERLEGYSSRKQ